MGARIHSPARVLLFTVLLFQVMSICGLSVSAQTRASSSSPSLATVPGIPVPVDVSVFTPPGSAESFYREVCGVWQNPDLSTTATNVLRTDFSWGPDFEVRNSLEIDISSDGIFRVREPYLGLIVMAVAEIGDSRYRLQLGQGKNIMCSTDLRISQHDGFAYLEEQGSQQRCLGRGRLVRLAGPNTPSSRAAALLSRQSAARGRFDATILAPAAAGELVGNVAKKAVDGLLSGRMEALSSIVHPALGLRFSPSRLIQLEAPVFTPDDVAHLDSVDTDFFWGYDGDTGQAVRVNPSGYLFRYVRYPRFLPAHETVFNEFRRAEIANIYDVFPGSVVVEYLSFRNSLTLVLASYAGSWRLCAVLSFVHAP